MPLSAAVYLLILSVAIPWLAFESKKKLDAGYRFPKLPFYAESILLQIVLTAAALWVAKRSNLALIFDPPRDLASVAASLTLFLVAIALMFLGWRTASEESRRRLRLIIPLTRTERSVWPLVCLGAGVCEEIVYRGVLFGILESIVHDWWLAAILSSLIFALAHSIQGWGAAAAIGGFAIVFQMMVRFTGSLFASIAIHVLYDLAAGYLLGRLTLPGSQITSATDEEM